MKIFSIKANLFGYDINKKGSKEGEIKIAESLGVASATVKFIINRYFISILKYFLLDISCYFNDWCIILK